MKGNIISDIGIYVRGEIYLTFEKELKYDRGHISGRGYIFDR